MLVPGLKMNSEIDPLNVPILAEHQSPPSSTTPKSKLTKRIVIPSVVSGALALGIISFVCSLTPSVPVIPPPLYSVIIDAGSSGSRVHVFKYSINESGEPVFNFGSRYYTSSRFPDGLSTFANDLEGARAKVQQLVNFAKANVPGPMTHKIDIRLMATAGMRLIPKDDQDRILDVIQQVLRSSGFKFQNDWATIISGSDEGVYAWVIANHARGSLGSNPSQTTGILELGGASAQVTFVSNDLYVFPVDFRKKSYKWVSYRIYSHSFNKYGKDAALKRVLDNLQNSTTGDDKVQDPCTPRGYIYQNNIQKYLSVFLADESKYTKLEAAGNFEQCKIKTLELLKERNAMCPRSYSCAIGSIYTPPLQGNFLGMASFFFTGKFFDLNQANLLYDLREKGEVFCQKSWQELKTAYEHIPHYDVEYLRGYCFTSAYIISMLETLGVDNGRITYSDKENNIPLSWALGAFIDTVSQSRSIAPAPSPSSGNGGNSRRFLGL